MGTPTETKNTREWSRFPKNVVVFDSTLKREKKNEISIEFGEYFSTRFVYICY